MLPVSHHSKIFFSLYLNWIYCSSVASCPLPLVLSLYATEKSSIFFTPPTPPSFYMSTWHAGSILGWAFLVLREGDSLKSTSCPEPLFSPWPYPMAFFQSGPWTGQCLHSWSPRLWSFYLFIYLVPFSHDPSLCHLIAETRLPLIFSCSSSSHHLNDELVS